MIRMALTKGRIETGALKILSRAGYDVSELDEDKKGRKLLFRLGGADIEIVLAKAADVITYVERGVCDAGVVGEDTIMECGAELYELLDLNFGKCRFALAGPSDSGDPADIAAAANCFFTGYRHRVIASKYPNVTREYFKSKGMDVEIVRIEGSVELAPLLGLADAIVDIVETGSTLKANGLEVYEDVAPISARLIVNTAAIKMKKAEFDPLIDNIAAAVKADNE